MKHLSQIQLPIEEELKQFDAFFDRSLQSEHALLSEIMTYVKQRRGKRMRPILALLIGKLLCGKVNEATYHTALSLELLHTASLIHDDVVDGSGERRGQPSVNSRWGNRLAVLAGDYVFAVALQEAARTQHTAIVDILAVLGQNLAGGEVLQLSSVEGDLIEEKTYLEVVKNKTAVLFASCARGAALSVDASQVLTDCVTDFGLYLGICFQIKDDILDYFDSETLGKPTENDMKEGKLTLPFLYAYRVAATPEITRLLAKVKRCEASPEEIHTLVLFARENGGIAYATQVMNDYKQKALQQLDCFADSPLKEALKNYLDLIVDRSL